MHEITLSPTVVNRVMTRRGTLNPFGTIDPTRTALLVVDMQTVFCKPGMPFYGESTADIIPNVNRLAAATRAAGGLVVWIQMAATESSITDWSVFFDVFCSPDLRARAIAEMKPGSEGYQIADGLDVRPVDIHSEKARFSALIQGSSDLDAMLRARGINTVIVSGCVTNVCCESTARDAMMLNYKTLFATDANAARSDDEHNATLNSLMNMFCDVRGTDALCELLRECAPPLRKAG